MSGTRAWPRVCGTVLSGTHSLLAMAQRGDGTLAMLLALLLFLGAVGGTAVWTMFTIDVGGPPSEGGNDVIDIDPEPTPPGRVPAG